MRYVVASQRELMIVSALIISVHLVRLALNFFGEFTLCIFVAVIVRNSLL